MQALRRIEEQAGGRLGAFVLDPASGRSFGWRQDERFAHCSSFKMSLAALLLAEADRGAVDPREVLRWSRADLISNSPVTSKHVDEGLSMRELARATLVTSDNTAANVLLRRLGGPAQVTRFWRSLGDRVSRLDRYEPELNETPVGTALDTTTPAAMGQTVAKLVLGNRLTPASRSTLRAWMIEVETGLKRLRAGFPADWVSGDKTGTGRSDRQHVYVDLAFGGRAGSVPIVVAAYYEPARLDVALEPVALKVLADVGRTAASTLRAAPAAALLRTGRTLI